MDAAVRCFERAIAIDPKFALAHAALGETWVHLGIRAAVTQSYRPREAMPRARAAVEQALALDDSLSDAHAVLGHVSFVYEWKRELGVAELRRAIELNPSNQNAHHWYGMSLSGLGRFDDALSQLERARAIDPLSVIVNANIGFVLYRAGRIDEAVEKLRHTVAMEPMFAMSRYRLGLALEEQGRYEEALEQFEAMRPGAAEPLGLTAIARTFALMGRETESRALLAQLHEIARTTYIPSALIADVHLALAENDAALQWLARAVEERALVAMWLPWDRHWDSLRGDHRFGELLRQAGF
jgi:Tfp pilus assembly protein PilF